MAVGGPLAGARLTALPHQDAGMSANLCVESHLRDLVESGFEVAVVSDAMAAAQPRSWDTATPPR